MRCLLQVGNVRHQSAPFDKPSNQSPLLYIPMGRSSSQLGHFFWPHVRRDTGGDAGAKWNRKCSAKLNLWEIEQNLDQERNTRRLCCFEQLSSNDHVKGSAADHGKAWVKRCCKSGSHIPLASSVDMAPLVGLLTITFLNRLTVGFAKRCQ